MNKRLVTAGCGLNWLKPELELKSGFGLTPELRLKPEFGLKLA